MSRFRGVIVVMPTPFDEQGAVNQRDVTRSVEFNVEAGVHGVSHILGASEFHTLTDDERHLVTRLTVEAVDGSVPVVIGVAGTSSQHAVELARRAEELGADSVCARPPYAAVGGPISGPELVEYYGAIGDAVAIPVMIQNCPPTSVSAAALADLFKLPNIEYVKEETAQAGHVMSEVIRLAGDSCKGVLGGNGGTAIPDEYRRGSTGTMPGAHVPEVFVAMWNALESGDEALARELRQRALPMGLLETRFFPRLYKEVLVRRGVISTAKTRATGTPSLDEFDGSELDTVLGEIGDLLG